MKLVNDNENEFQEGITYRPGGYLAPEIPCAQIVFIEDGMVTYHYGIYRSSKRTIKFIETYKIPLEEFSETYDPLVTTNDRWVFED